ncbi:MAG: hypothetical protein RBR63_08645 [Methanosarcina vacuolata]|jgi:hypothetical protein|nr:hypothetical protein [Methanosarcina vacuolata]
MSWVIACKNKFSLHVPVQSSLQQEECANWDLTVEIDIPFPAQFLSGYGNPALGFQDDL